MMLTYLDSSTDLSVFQAPAKSDKRLDGISGSV
jgi:hypothetical protein